MEKAYWLSRKTATMNLARNAANSEARLVHYELAGRYSLKAALAEDLAAISADALPSAISGSGRAPIEGSDDA